MLVCIAILLFMHMIDVHKKIVSTFFLLLLSAVAIYLDTS